MKAQLQQWQSLPNIWVTWCRSHIITEDLEAFLSPEQAKEAFEMLDNNGDGKLVLADIRDAVIKIYKERRNLALSLKVPLMAAFHCTASLSFSNSVGKHG